MKLFDQIQREGGAFITGTGTGVGKTWVACRLAQALRARGLVVGVFKPAESGAGADAAKLKRAAASALPLEVIRPYHFERPLAPAVAAEWEGQRVSLARLQKIYRSIQAQSDVVLVEGAGGLLVPYGPRLLGADLAKAFKLPLLIVAQAGLGTINHSLLTLEAAQRRRLKVLAVLLNGRPKKADLSEATNLHQIQKAAGVKVLRVGTNGRDL